MLAVGGAELEEYEEAHSDNEGQESSQQGIGKALHHPEEECENQPDSCQQEACQQGEELDVELLGAVAASLYLQRDFPMSPQKIKDSKKR